MGPGPRGRLGRHQKQCSAQCVRHPVRRPPGLQLGASPGSEPLVGWGHVTSVLARPCLAASCCATRARFAGGRGSGCPRPLLKAWPPLTDACWCRLVPPPPPGVRSPAVLALPGAPGGIGRGGGAPYVAWRSSAAPPCPPPRTWHIVYDCVQRKATAAGVAVEFPGA